MTIQIRYDIPTPKPVLGRIPKYPVRDMRVGGSFEVPCEDKATAKRIISAVQSAARRHGFKIEIRSLKNAVGVWRTA